MFAVLAYVANIVLDYNYMFLMSDDGTPYSIFYILVNGSPIFYPLLVVGAFVVYIVLFYYVYELVKKNQKSKIKSDNKKIASTN